MRPMRKKYTDEFRAAVLAEIAKADFSVNATLARFEVPRSTYQEWKRRIARYGSPNARIGGRPRKRTHLDERIDQLEDRVESLEEGFDAQISPAPEIEHGRSSHVD